MAAASLSPRRGISRARRKTSLGRNAHAVSILLPSAWQENRKTHPAADGKRIRFNPSECPPFLRQQG